jgi:hypothetical protein
MAKHFEPVEIFFSAIYLLVGMVGLGIEYLHEGRLSKDVIILFAVYMASIIAGQALARFDDKQDKIQDGIETLKSQNVEFGNRLKTIEKSLGDLEKAARYTSQ